VDPGLKRLQQELASVAEGLSADQWNWHPPGKWCAAEVLEHLYLTYTGTIKGLERMMTAGEPRTMPATWRQRGRKMVVLQFSYMPPGREAPKLSRPRGAPAEKVRAEIGPKIAEMDEWIARCEEKFGAARRLMDHPIIGPLTGSQWRKFHVVHGRHHLKQIRRLRDGVERDTDRCKN
jgi:hypothetical protein